MGVVPEPDFLLVQKMRMGDEKALEAFVTKYYSKILAYCRMHTDDQDYAQDLAQETFARFFRSFRQYQHYGKAANYLYVVASNLCSDYYRRKKEQLFDTDAVRDAPDERCGDPDIGLMVRMALERLPEEIRETAVLYFMQERKQKDIAAILGIGLPLVKYRIRRARELLSEYLE
ncbi:MAG: RNA polymerase sigma factor [Eubacterium sp.]|nr:RNA polymerase sigma factor [Eubacterium sp.]